MSRLDALVGREYESGGETKTAWTKVGVAFPNKSGNGYTLFLECLPLPGPDGKCKLSLFPPRPKEGEQRQQPAPRQGGGGYEDRDYGHQGDDNIPF
jgi:hypothetical protein